jgi:multidrug efflux system membrane fusion protein
VIDGADKLRDGAKINVRSEADTNVTPADPGAGPSAAPAAGPGDAGKGGKRRHQQNGQKQDNGQQQ